MMAKKVALISDVHSNILALDAVIERIDELGIEDTYCLGDLVGYTPFPNEVIERLRNTAIPCIMGNYDDGVAYSKPECSCLYDTEEEVRLGGASLLWTIKNTSPENREWLKTLPKELRLTIDGHRILLFHGSPWRLEEYLHEDSPTGVFKKAIREFPADVYIFAHTHRPYVKRADVSLFVNVGSVGKPANPCLAAEFAVLTVDTGTVSCHFEQVAYAVDALREAIRESELPDGTISVWYRASYPE